MKSLTECLQAALNEQNINESKSVLSEFVPYDDNEDNGSECTGSVEPYCEKLKNLKPNDMKKIRDWKGFDKDKLEDYCTTVAAVANYITSLCDIARDERDSNSYDSIKDGIETVADIEEWMGYDSTLENLKHDGDLKTADDWDEIEVILKDVLNHMNEVSKVFLRMDWQ